MIEFFNYIFKEDVLKMDEKRLLSRLISFSIKVFLLLSAIAIPLIMTSLIDVTVNGQTYSGFSGIFYAIAIIFIPCAVLPIALLFAIRTNRS